MTRAMFNHRLSLESRPGVAKVTHKATGAVAYVWDTNGAPCAAVFAPKAFKPAWRYRFRSPAEREKRVSGFFAGLSARQERNATRRADRSAETHNLELGHVLRSSWGYEQTNVCWYQVTRVVSPKMVEIRRIGTIHGEALSGMSRKVLPALDDFQGEPMRKRVGRGGVKITSYEFAYVWDGKPAFESSWH